MEWPNNPKIYEINTHVWLTTLGQQYGQDVTLATVPDAVLDELAAYHVDAVWLMGVWFRGASSLNSALNYVHQYRGALPDITDDDVIGSAYAIGAYQIDEAIGGRDGLVDFRERLHERGIRLILDFVPNHTGMDHPWLVERPDYYVQASPDMLQKTTGEFFVKTDSAGREHIIAHGRDPYFPGWIDTAQLNAFHQGYRQAAVRTLQEIATMADGVRCDMAMLMMNDVFVRTWHWLGFTENEQPDVDFWNYVIPRVRDKNNNFIFIAEAYWGLNHALNQQGFDYTYDKLLYDRLLSGDVNGIQAHLSADLDYLKKQIRFIENHDEPRAAESFGVARSRPAAVMIHTLPGATLLHDGQFTGRQVKLPVQINRQPDENEYIALKEFYLRLLNEAQDDVYHSGDWQLFPCDAACDGCEGDYNIVAYGWQHNDDYRLIVINLSDEWSQASVGLDTWSDYLEQNDWRLLDVLHRTYREDSREDMLDDGLRVDLEPSQAVIYHFTPMKKRNVRRRRRRTSTEENA